MTLTLKGKTSIENIYLYWNSEKGLYRSVTPDSSFVLAEGADPIGLNPMSGVGHPAIDGSYIANNLENFYIISAPGVADTTMTIGTDGKVAAVTAE